MTEVTCRGSYTLGTACEKCSRCKKEREQIQHQAVDEYAQKEMDLLIYGMYITQNGKRIDPLSVLIETKNGYVLRPDDLAYKENKDEQKDKT